MTNEEYIQHVQELAIAGDYAGLFKLAQHEEQQCRRVLACGAGALAFQMSIINDMRDFAAEGRAMLAAEGRAMLAELPAPTQPAQPTLPARIAIWLVVGSTAALGTLAVLATAAALCSL